MSKKLTSAEAAFIRELNTLITRANITPEEALKIAIEHYGNYDKIVAKLAEEKSQNAEK